MEDFPRWFGAYQDRARCLAKILSLFSSKRGAITKSFVDEKITDEDESLISKTLAYAVSDGLLLVDNNVYIKNNSYKEPKVIRNMEAIEPHSYKENYKYNKERERIVNIVESSEGITVRDTAKSVGLDRIVVDGIMRRLYRDKRIDKIIVKRGKWRRILYIGVKTNEN